MRKILLRCPIVLAALFAAFPQSAATAQEADPLPRDIGDIRIRDPFILTDARNGRYILVANMSNHQKGTKGWECYTSKDLRHWQAPVSVFTPPEGFWADRDFRRRKSILTWASVTSWGRSARTAPIAAPRSSLPISLSDPTGRSAIVRQPRTTGWRWTERSTSRTATLGWCFAMNGSRLVMAP